MNWSMCRGAAAAIRRLTILLCAIGGSLLASHAPILAQELPALVLPKRDEALPGKRIGWRFDDITAALTQANTDGKPLVVVFVAEPCGWCRIFLAHVLRCDGFNALAGQAHFAILTNVTGANARPGEEDQRQLGRLLKVEGYPTTAVVSVKAGTITPVAKIAGTTSEASLLASLSKAGLTVPPSTGARAQQAAIGLPRPAACGATKPEATLEASTPRRVQAGISP